MPLGVGLVLLVGRGHEAHVGVGGDLEHPALAERLEGVQQGLADLLVEVGLHAAERDDETADRADGAAAVLGHAGLEQLWGLVDDYVGRQPVLERRVGLGERDLGERVLPLLGAAEEVGPEHDLLLEGVVVRPVVVLRLVEPGRVEHDELTGLAVVRAGAHAVLDRRQRHGEGMVAVVEGQQGRLGHWMPPGRGQRALD